MVETLDLCGVQQHAAKNLDDLLAGDSAIVVGRKRLIRPIGCSLAPAGARAPFRSRFLRSHGLGESR